MNSEPKPGSNLSHYRILSKLGGGGMGEVYLAEDTKLNRRVAIKLLTESAYGDKQAHQRLIREARTAANLDHPNICSIHEIADDGGHSFICMQYVEGETLDSLLKRKTFSHNLSLKREAEPLFKILPEPKQMVTYEGGHVPPLELLVKTMNGFFDQTMGPVRRQ